MPKTRLTKESLSNHFHYAKWIYVLIICLSAFGLDLLFTVTEYHPPAERKVEIYLMGGLGDVEQLDGLAARALEYGKTIDPTLEEVTFLPLSYTGEDDIYGPQKLMVLLAAQEGHVYFVDRTYLEQFINMGVAQPLEGYIDQGLLDPGDRDLSNVTYEEPAPDEDTPPSGATHVYALQAEPLQGLMQTEEPIYYPDDKYIVVCSYVKNMDTTVQVLQFVMDELSTADTQAGTPAATEAPAGTEAPSEAGTEAPTETEAPSEAGTEAPTETEAPAVTEAPAATEAPAQIAAAAAE